MEYERAGLAFLPLRANDDFALRLAQHFKIRDPDELVRNVPFANGDYCPTITEAVSTKDSRRLSGRKACIVYSYSKSAYNGTLEAAFARIQFMADAAHRAGAKEVYLVLAEHMFDRQDLDPALIYTAEADEISDGKRRKLGKMQGQPFNLEVVIRGFHNAGIKRVLTLDRHSSATDRIYGEVYKSSPEQVLFNLNSVPIFVNYLLRSGIALERDGSNLVIVAPDKGAKDAIESFYDMLGMPKTSRVHCNKYRQAPNDPRKLEAEVTWKSENFCGIDGKIVVALDDKGDTFGTLQKTLVEGLAEYGRPKQIHAMLSHMLFSTRGAYELVEDNKINVHGSNSHPNMTFKKDEPGVGQITVLDFTPYFAWALANHVTKGEPLPEVGKEDLVRYSDFFTVAKQGRIIDF